MYCLAYTHAHNVCMPLIETYKHAFVHTCMCTCVCAHLHVHMLYVVSWGIIELKLDALSPATDELLKGLAVSSSSKAEAIAVLKRAVEVCNACVCVCVCVYVCVLFLSQAAELGAKRTISMQASAGRASNVNASQLTQRDPGAHAVCLWLRAVLGSLIEN